MPGLADLTGRRAFAAELAREAAAILYRMRGTADVVWKARGDLVTAADKAAEAHIVSRLAERFPEDSIVGEEGGGSTIVASDWVWYVDPLDGTTNFVHGLPHYCTSIGATFRGRPAVGAIAAPELGDPDNGGRLWLAARGLGATLDGVPIHVSPVAELGQALAATGFPYDRSTRAAELVRPVERALVKCLCVRRLGSAALDLALVASGTFPIFWESHLKPWDLAAGVVLVEEAGGRVTDHAGGAGWLASGDVVATNGVLHDAFVRDVLGA